MSENTTHFKASERPDHLWCADDVAAYLKTSRSWVYKASADGTLPSIRIGGVVRFLPSRVRAIVESQQSNPGVTP